MAQLIDKDALVAEIESYKNSFCDRNGYLEDSETNGLAYDTLCELEDSIDTLEVKEVDLEHEVESYWKQCDMTWCRDAYSMTHIRSMLSDIAKHFFSLGMRVSNKEQK